APSRQTSGRNKNANAPSRQTSGPSVWPHSSEPWGSIQSSREVESRKATAMVPAPILSSDSHVFEPPDLWTRRIDAAFRARAPRMQRINDVDQLVVEEHQVIAGIGLISNAGA